MSKNIFNTIMLKAPKKSFFDLSHDVKTTFDMGQLIPVCNFECFPGDKMNIGAETVIKFAPMLAPVMHRLDATIHYFFVPRRLLWDNFTEYINRNPTGGSPVHPFLYMTNANTGIGTLPDYMGLPTMASVNTIKVDAMPFAAYQKVYSDYYRDQNLISETFVKLIDGDNAALAPGLLAIRKRAWEHDYFTASLPTAQQGTGVDIPIGSVSLQQNAQVLRNVSTGTTTQWTATSGPTPVTAGGLNVGTDVPANALFAQVNATGSVGSTKLTDLRRAFRLQEWLEKQMRAGKRLFESNLQHFGVKSKDERLQRSEYITGVKTPVVVSDVVSTFTSGAAAPQGSRTGIGTAVVTSDQKTYFCEEHGIIIGLMSVMPKTAYQQGIYKPWLKSDADVVDAYAWPEFALIGEQAVTKKEVYADSASPNAVFGYVPRYAEHMFIPNRVSGNFKTNLNYWHFGRIFSTEPSLNQAFVECDYNSLLRSFAVQDPAVSRLYVHVLNKITGIRPFPKYGQPTI